MRVEGVRSGYVVRDPEAETARRENRIDGLLLEDRLARERQVCIGRHQERTGGQRRAGVPQGEEGGHRQPTSGRLAGEGDLTGVDALS
jgi:hypothetical protein